jgi:peptide/nickel transport system substrate-binding protein
MAVPRRRPRRSAVTLLFAVAASVASPGHAPAQDEPRDTLTIGIAQMSATLHPLIVGHVAKRYLLAMTLRPLVVFDKDWKQSCPVCADGRLSEGSQVTTVSLHPKARWGDGTPVTAEDAVFAWEVGRHAEGGATYHTMFRSIRRIEVFDDKTFRIHSDGPLALGEYYLLPAHLEGKIFAGAPREYGRRTRYDTDPTNPGLYHGPYRIAALVPGSEVVLERNPHWFGAPPYFRRITVKLLGDTAKAEASLLSGAIDYLAGEVGLSLEQVIEIEARHRDRFRFVYKPSLAYEHIAVNLDHAILADRRVRQALLLAIDREAVMREVYGGRIPVAHTFSLPEEMLGEAGVAHHPHDPTRAKALLDAAGWSEIRDGVRHDKAGVRLAFAFMTTEGNRGRERVQQIVQRQWREIGVEARIVNQPTRMLFDVTLKQRKFEGVVLKAWFRGPRSYGSFFLHSPEIPTAANNYAGQNYSGFRAADRVLAALARAGGQEKDALLVELQKTYTEELPELPLHFRGEAYVMPHWLEGVEPTGHADHSTNRVEYWRAK